MKNIKFLLVLGLIFVNFSCDRELLTPYYPGALTQDIAIKSTADLVKLMNNAYASLVPTNEFDFNSVFTDECGIGYANGGQGLTDGNYGFILKPLTPYPNNIWEDYYYTLSIVNRVIKFSTNISPVDSSDQAAINQVVAEALTVRAYCHIQLVSYFSTNPKDLNALGVPISNDVYPITYKPSRDKNGDIYSQIDQDLTDAITKFNSASSVFSPIYASSTFALALKARSYALRGDYTNAATYATQVITSSGLTLANYSNYANVFHTDDNPDGVEVIFKLKQNINQTRTGAIWASVNTTVAGSPFYEMGRSLFNILNTTNLSTASNLTITAISGNNITVPGNNLSVGDMFVSTVSYPTGASTANGTTTSPANALLGGKVYFVKSVSGNVITLTNTANGTTAISFSGANGSSLSIPAKANYGDIRYAINVHPTSIIDYNYQTSSDYRNTDKLCIRKYPGRSNSGLMVNDIKLCRLSEMFLILAEAQVSQNDLTSASFTIKALRDSRYNTPQAAPVYATATDAWKDILKERRVEFCYEGYRYIDLKRLGLVANEGVTRDSQDCAVNNACSLSVTDYRFTLPIPSDEINGNPAIQSQQNPGY